MLYQVHVARQQVLPELVRNIIGVRGINIAKKNQRPQKNFPVLAHVVENAGPVEPPFGVQCLVLFAPSSLVPFLTRRNVTSPISRLGSLETVLPRNRFLFLPG